MKIIYIGVEVYNSVLKICSMLADRGHEVVCVVQGDYGYKQETPPVYNDKLKIVRVPYTFMLDPEKLNRMIEKIVILLGTDVDIIFGSHVPIIPPIVNIGKKYNIHTGGMILDVPTDVIRRVPWKREQWRILSSFIPRLDLPILNTFVAKGELEKLLKISIPDENVITYAFYTLPEYKNMGLKKDAGYIVSACRLTVEKNCILIPKALKYLKSTIPYAAIGNDNGQLDEIRKYCLDNDIDLLAVGEITEEKKYDIISRASMLIYPQRVKTIGGLSPFEAMYAGTPTLVPDVKIMHELFKDNVFYFKNDDEASLGEKIKEVKSLGKEKLKDKLKEASDYAFSIGNFDVMVDKLEERMVKLKNE